MAPPWTVIVVTILLLVPSAALLYPIVARLRRRSSKPRSGTLKVLHLGNKPAFEIIAVHGLGGDPDHTWTRSMPAEAGSALPRKRVHLLKDLLSKTFPDARISSFEDDSDWLIDAPIKTTEEIGKSLLDAVRARQHGPVHLPIIFIGHSLGGIIVKQALSRQESQEVFDDTSGIIFLGTPHQGSSVSAVGAALASMTAFLGSSPSLLFSLASHDGQLSDLTVRFSACVALAERRQQPFNIREFYETKPTYLLGWFPIGLVVYRDSATAHSPGTAKPISTDHSGLNKCTGEDDELYQELVRAIRDLRAPSWLQRADQLLLDGHYTEERLKIERLSGDRLPMDQCYINLALVEKSSQGADSDDSFSILDRQKVQTPDESMQVDLAAIFEQRRARDDYTIEPKRIFIRGRAGVGKTTLCKKMVHAFVHDGIWNGKFDRLLWVPLRRLKYLQKGRRDLEAFFEIEYFGACRAQDARRFARALHQAVNRDDAKTLFILDGWDEVAEQWSSDDPTFDLLKTLLNQPYAVITSRPSANLSAGLLPVDLEVETIGFYPEQVKAYVGANSETELKAKEIQSFLQKHWLIQGLVRIPIQLDALCYTWDDINLDEVPSTMTGMYRMIVGKLWTKDAKSLNRVKTSSDLEPDFVRSYVRPEDAYLQVLAFTGMCNNMIDFSPSHCQIIAARSDLGDVLPKMKHLSFLRTSDTKAKRDDRNYHFLHLTSQEYFAALYFVRRWMAQERLECLSLRDKKTHDLTPIEFLQKHKYSARYDVFWRFVAGLLDGEDTGETLRFFNEIEAEPRDLLGPAHQRLVMHCLSELSHEIQIRQSLENTLSGWLLFECRFRKTASLSGEAEFPEAALHCALLEETKATTMILQSLKIRAMLPPVVLATVAALLEHHDIEVQRVAIEALGKQSLPPEILSAIAKRSEDSNTTIRSAAVEALGRQSTISPENLATIVSRLGDEDGNVRWQVAETLQQQPKLPHETIAALVARLQDKDQVGRPEAARALRDRHTAFPEILPVLQARFEDENEDILVRDGAIRGIVSDAAMPPTVLSAVVARLEDRAGYIRMQAAEALRRQPGLPPSTLLALVALLEDEEDSVRWNAAMCLGAQKSAWQPEILKAITARLDHQSPRVREAAVVALGSHDTLPPVVHPALVARLEDEDGRMQRLTLFYLRRHQPTWLPETLVAIIARLEDPDWRLRTGALRALQGQRQTALPPSPETLSGVTARLGDDEEAVRAEAMTTLRRFSQFALAPKTLAIVTSLCEDPDPRVRTEAIGLLAEQQSPLPPEALVAIVARLGDGDEDVQRAAFKALRKYPSSFGSLLGGPHAASLFTLALKQAFREHLSWYQVGDQLCISTPEQTVEIPIDAQGTDIRTLIRKLQPSDMP